MATSINSPNLSNAIRTDVPAISTILKALAKSDPSVLTGLENGTKRIVGENSRWSFQEYVDGSWVTRKQFNIDATSVDGYSTSIDVAASTIVVRGTDKKIKGDLTGKADTAGTADKLASTLAVNAGGTGATTAAAARTNLGVPPTSHASTGTSYGVSTDNNYGHAKASATSPKALGTAAVGSETASFARGDHVHPTTTATGSVLGMVKLSDSTTSTSAASAGIAASPKAVKAAMDKATSAATAADTANTTANTALGIIPSGTKMLFHQAAAPTGWVKQTSVNDATLRVVSGDTGGGTGGSIAFSTLFASGKSVSLSGSVGATTLTVAQMPSHSHSTNIPICAGSGSKTYAGAYHEFSGYWSTNATGGSSSHTHSLGGSASINLSVKYTDVIICSKS